MTNEELAVVEMKFKSKHNHLTGAVHYVSVWSREYIIHIGIILSGYDAVPSLTYWKSLYHFMGYLYHKPHVLMMFLVRKSIGHI